MFAKMGQYNIANDIESIQALTLLYLKSEGVIDFEAFLRAHSSVVFDTAIIMGTDISNFVGSGQIANEYKTAFGRKVEYSELAPIIYSLYAIRYAKWFGVQVVFHTRT